MVVNMKLNEDIVLLKQIMAVGKLPAIFSQDKTKRTIFYVILFIFYLITWIGSCASMLFFWNRFRWTTIFLSICMTLFMTVFHLSNMTGNFRRRENWKKLVRNFSEMDVMTMFTFDGNNKIIHLKIWVFNCTFYIIEVAWNFSYFLLREVPAYYIFSSMYYILTLLMGQWLVASMNQLSSMMLARYQCTEQMIRAVILDQRSFLVKKRLKLIQKIVCMMNDCITLINGLFGGRLILLMVMTFIYILGIFDYTLNISHHAEWFIAIVFIYQCLTLSIFTIRIVHSCDKIEKSYEKLLTTTNVLQMQIDDETKRDALLALFDYMKKMRPKISAAGFFQVNQSLFSSFLTALVSYSIIVVQLETSNVS